MTTFRTHVEQMLAHHDVPFAVTYERDSHQLQRLGNFDSEEFSGLYNTHFHSEDMALNTLKSLEGQILPQMVSQGDTTCFLDRPKPNLLVGWFKTSQMDGVALYMFGSELHEKLAAELKN